MSASLVLSCLAEWRATSHPDKYSGYVDTVTTRRREINGMHQGEYRVVTRRFRAKKVFGPFFETFEPGDELVFLLHAGSAKEMSVFATLESVRSCKPGTPTPQYEAEKRLFETSTSATEK